MKFVIWQAGITIACSAVAIFFAKISKMSCFWCCSTDCADLLKKSYQISDVSYVCVPRLKKLTEESMYYLMVNPDINSDNIPDMSDAPIMGNIKLFSKCSEEHIHQTVCKRSVLVK